MAVARIFVVSVARLDRLARLAPVGIAPSPCANVGDELRDRAFARTMCARPTSIRRSTSRDTKASASIAAHSLAASTAAPSWLTRAAFSASAAASAGLPGATIAQPSMKICAPICSATACPLTRDRSAVGRRNAALQIEPGRVLGRVAVAAPPQDRAMLDDVVEPGLADLARRDVAARPMILERPDEGEGPGDVVVGDDQRSSSAARGHKSRSARARA